MANKGVITRKDIITDEALRFGIEYKKNVDLAIAANKELIQSALQYDQIAKAFNASEGNKQFMKVKEQELQMNDKVMKQMKEKIQLDTLMKKQKTLVAILLSGFVFAANVQAGLTVKCKKISTGGTICCASDGENVNCTYLTPGGGT